MHEKRFLEAERRLFDAAGLEHRERWLELPTLGVRTRVLEAGAGEPALFLHGGPMAAGTWAYVAAALRGVRAILLDRPGCGLSSPPPVVPDHTTLPGYVEQLTADVLDALGLADATLVGSSFGGYSALRSARALPDRVRSVYLAGCPPFVPGWTAPPFFTVLRAPVLGRLVLGLPPTAATVRMGLRQLGQRRALTAGRIPAPMLDWELAWQRDTDTMRRDAAMIRACGTFLGGFDDSLDLSAEELAEVTVPVHVLVGTDDPVGGAEVAERLAEMLPQSSVEVWDGVGHLPWLDDPGRVAESLSSVLTRH